MRFRAKHGNGGLVGGVRCVYHRAMTAQSPLIVDTEGSLDLDEVLSRPLFATLSTTADGVARGSPVWFLWEDGALWVIANTAHDTFAERVAREPRCAVSIIDFDPALGRVHHVGMRGRAAVVAFDRARALRKVERYLGGDHSRWPSDRFTLRAPTLALVRFAPETIVLRDQSYALGGKSPGDGV